MAIDRIVKQYFWAIPALLTLLVAFLNAQAVSQFIGLGLLPDEKALSYPPPVSRANAAPVTSARTLDGDGILRRDAFDHVKGPIVPVVESTETVSETVYSDPLTAPSCDGVKLLLTLVSEKDVDWSMAVLTAPGETKSVLRRRGEDIAGKKLEFVGWNRVWLKSGGSLCQSEMFKIGPEAPVAKPVSAAPAPTAGAPGAPGALDPSLAAGIRKRSATEFDIDRSVVDRILENQADLMRTARIVPEQENGKVVGIRLFGVRPDTLLGVIGMQNGDRLQTINGFDMASPEKALEAYARLRTADKLTVSINRGGQPVNLDYNIK